MNAATNSRLLNSLLPNSQKPAAFNILGKNSSSNSSSGSFGFGIFLISILVFVGILYFYKDNVQSAWNSISATIMGYFQGADSAKAVLPSQPPTDDSAHTNVTNPSPQQGEPGEPPSPSALSIVERVLPGGAGKEVFNISSNKYTYYDAEPLCKALGAELATYDQVKEAWSKGADWCNYGWIKGQMAVYPTSDDTYQKLQTGPAEQRLACGRPGMNGGHFDNPELRFGATCYGSKPPQSKHDEERAAAATPVSPDALIFDKKVAQFKSEADSIGVLPFNTKGWNN